MDLVSKLLLFLAAFLVNCSVAQGSVGNYFKCLKCFSEFRENYYYCNSSEDCLEATDSLSCEQSEKIQSFVECPTQINQELCTNYTFTAENFEQAEPIVQQNVLGAGEGCWMQVNRT